MKKQKNNGIVALLIYLAIIILAIYLSFAYDSCIINSDLPLWAKVRLLR